MNSKTFNKKQNCGNRDILDYLFDDHSWFNGTMKTNIKETSNEIVFAIEMPGFTKENIMITFKRDYLIVQGIYSDSSDQDDDSFIKHEINNKSVSRSYYLGNYTINEHSVTATYNSGILVINIPKEAKKQEDHFIKIN